MGIDYSVCLEDCSCSVVLARATQQAAALLAFGIIAVAVGLHAQSSTSKVVTGADIAKVLPPPDPSKAGTRFSKVIGWPEGLTPKAAAGFAVAPYATGLAQPRWLRRAAQR